MTGDFDWGFGCIGALAMLAAFAFDAVGLHWQAAIVPTAPGVASAVR